MARAASFLLLADSQASFRIEGESPPRNRIERWGRAVMQVGQRPLSVPELERLQSVLVEDARHITPGIRSEGVFLGDRDPDGAPLTDHIDWRPAVAGNVEVLNDTRDLYALFDVTDFAEFIYACVARIVERDLRREIAEIEAYDRARGGLAALFEMSDQKLSLLIRFIRQNGGRLSQARNNHSSSCSLSIWRICLVLRSQSCARCSIVP